MATDDRWNEEPDDRYRDELPRDPIGTAKSKVLIPAIGLIVAGVLGIGLTGWGFVQLQNMPAAMADANNKFASDPKLNAKQKQDAANLMNQIGDIVQKGGIVFYGINLIVALLVIFGGVQILTLSSRGFGIAAAILALIPCLNGCYQWLLATPFAIWAIVVLVNPVVKAGFDAKARGPRGDAA